MSPDTQSLRAFLSRVAARARWIDILYVEAALFVVAAAAIVTRVWQPATFTAAVGVVATMAVVAALVSMLVRRTPARRAAELIERRAPAARNILATATEIVDGRLAAKPYVVERVTRDAAAFAAEVDLSRALPLSRALGAAAVAAAAWIATVPFAAAPPGGAAIARPTNADAAVVSAVTIDVVPPDYARLSTRTFHNPSEIAAFAGSQLRVVVDADAAEVHLETVSGRRRLDPKGGRRFEIAVVADTDGYLAIEPAAASGTAGVRRLIGVTITPDLPPQVKMTQPGRDILLPNGSGSVEIAVEASDDLGLATLSARYTKVAGSGENFTFTTGDIPLTLARAGDRSWSGRGVIRLSPLGLEPGEMVIYRAIATDRRPGAVPVESDTFIIEIAAPGALPSEGFAIDDRQDRYAISQQMVIVKTEQLLARKPTMPADEFREAVAGVAAEQRQVRAEFVFMMGGELADEGLNQASLNEEAEAELEDDLAAGRLVNQGRADLIRAIRSMSRAATRLSDASLVEALPFEKQALTYLQRAFSRTRYILRTLTERERLDLSRRLTGVLSALARDRRPIVTADPPPRLVALRQVLAAVAALAGSDLSQPGHSSRASTLAETTLRIDPASEEIRRVAQSLTTVALSLDRRDVDAARADLDRTTSALASLVRAELFAAQHQFKTGTAAALDGALADELGRVPTGISR